MSNVLVDLSTAMAEATEKAGKSTLTVNARRRFPASGVAYAADLVLTADHAVERDEDISVVLPDNTEVPAKVAGRDPGSDLALLRLERPAATPAERAAGEPKPGQLVLMLGRSSSEGIEASLGVISAVSGPLRTPRGVLERFIRTDAISYPGFSGGPTVAADGTIVGLNSSGIARGMALTIPAEIAWRAAQMLAEHGSIRRGYLGIRSQQAEIPAAQQQALGREQAVGLLLVGIEEDSPASKANLLVGDILVGFEGVAISNHDELFAQLAGALVGKSVRLEVLRGGQVTTVNVVIEERQSAAAEDEDERHHHGHRGHGPWGHHDHGFGFGR